MKKLLLFLLLVGPLAYAQNLKPELWRKPWKASWITYSENANSIYSLQGLKDYGVFKFQKTVNLAEKPAKCLIHVSGDNRYKLYVNGTWVSAGPARGDLYFWNFETLDIAPYLKVGENTLEALVWNEGKGKSEAQISYATGFILQADEEAHAALNTNMNWQVAKNLGVSPLQPRVPGYYVAGQGELQEYAKSWSPFISAKSLGPGLTKGAAIDSRGWMLYPAAIPAMELKEQRFAAIRKGEGDLIHGKSLVVPANSSVDLWIDQGVLTNAYPQLTFSGGKDAKIGLTYAEGLYEKKPLSTTTKNGNHKGNRNDIEDKYWLGRKDSLIADGATHTFETMTYRTFRYVRLTVKTESDALTLQDFKSVFTGFPFQAKATLKTDNPLIPQLLDVGFRTARLCAMETYMDCPYYEQLQYIGDARIQALVSLYYAGDERLVRQALDHMDHSRIAEGITLSRYPTDLHQQIPTFSLWYIGMLHDYLRYGKDPSFLKNKLSGMRGILDYFSRFEGTDGTLQNIPYWTFSDWVNAWPRGIAPVGPSGRSAVIDFQYVWILQNAAEIERYFGFPELAARYEAKVKALKPVLRALYWDAARGLYADTEVHDKFSQHANSLAILAGFDAGGVSSKLLTDKDLAPASIYFKYYLHLALTKAGQGNDYMKWLDKWKENIDMGLSTWAETSDISTSRSDCHAWGASPNIEFFRIVLGVDSDAPAFAKVKIEPHLGELKEVEGIVPHPQGEIQVQYKSGSASITLPGTVNGTFVWKGKKYPLKAGKNSINTQK
ncbi:alpha-rhamnosidase [Aquirufa echingensis]|uniref:Alpha-rhamnosidase n=1 Tax=Aquirufa echingensis TaxID=3096516 RepID=A0ABW6CWC2_9BACT